MNDTLTAVFSTPSCDTLCTLRADWLQAGYAPGAPLLGVLDQYFVFLNELSASMSAREYSHLATMFDIGAVGGVALQNLLETDDLANLWKRLLAGGISEGLMVLASRQYVKAAETEIVSVYRNAGWYVYRALWQLSAQLQPDADPAQRRQVLDRLLAPVHDDAVPGPAKAVLLGRLFQLLLLAHLAANGVQ
ncbi:MAG: hypothetical protein H6662_10645 [Ardenticatenaceae bacterium]|nr:hypothetical protein [Ardenticatenaceae bacterium]MCB8989609.1 hypothetical protein [Ardenticatenaceae bacterium]MCB9003152.1 hypothetical protein [Ardenticatenaceae bacterium]